LRANRKSISHRCFLLEVVFVRECKETIHLPLGCLQGGVQTRLSLMLVANRASLPKKWPPHPRNVANSSDLTEPTKTTQPVMADQVGARKTLLPLLHSSLELSDTKVHEPETLTQRQYATSGSEAGSYFRRLDSCVTQLNAQGSSRTCNESQEEMTRDRC